MNICPNLKNEEVKQLFNNLIDLFGENIAYYLWDKNNGNSLDMAPNGAVSELFKSLVDYYEGDVKKAYYSKAKVYSGQFMSLFGDWISDPEHSSKAVDSNGEPLLLYHGTDSIFEHFDVNYQKHHVHEKGGIYFTDSIRKSKVYGDVIYAAYLNMRNPGLSNVTDGTLKSLDEYNKLENQIILDDKFDSAIFIRYDKEGDNHGAIPTKLYVIKSDSQAIDIQRNNTSNLMYNRSLSSKNEAAYRYALQIIRLYNGGRRSLYKMLAQMREYNQNNGTNVSIIYDTKAYLIRPTVPLNIAGAKKLREKYSRMGIGAYSNVAEAVIEVISAIFPDLKIIMATDDQYTNWCREHHYPHNSNSMIAGDTIIYKRSALNPQIATEELLHTFVRNLAIHKKELANRLFIAAREEDPRLWFEILLLYKDQPYAVLADELITLLLSKYVADKAIKRSYRDKDGNVKIKTKNFKLVASEFFEYLFDILKYVFPVLTKHGKTTFDFNDLQNGTTFELLSEMMLTNDLYIPVETLDKDQVRYNLKKDEISLKIQILFKNLLQTLQQTPNKNTRRYKTIDEVTKVINEIKGLKKISDAATMIYALSFGLKQLGQNLLNKPNSAEANTILGFLLKQKTNNYSNTTADHITDIYQNIISFYTALLKLIPTDPYSEVEDQDDAKKILLYRDAINRSLLQIEELWKEAATHVGDNIVDEIIDRLTVYSDEDKENMKVVAKDWLHKNSFYGDINDIQAIKYYEQSDSDVIRQAFLIISEVVHKTRVQFLPERIKLILSFRKAQSLSKHLTPGNWQTVLMERYTDGDKKGLFTSNFISDYNYGLYEEDLLLFINQYNKEFEAKHGFLYLQDSETGDYYNNITGVYATEEEWDGDREPLFYTYLRGINEWKDKHCNRRYTLNYYNERMSRPYSEEYPNGHGLSPKTLRLYQAIQSNINLYLDKATQAGGIEELSNDDINTLEYYLQLLEDLSNMFLKDGTMKSDEDVLIALELSSWQRFISDKLLKQYDLTAFELRKNYLLDLIQKAKTKNEKDIAYTKYYNFLRYYSTYQINPKLYAKDADSDLNELLIIQSNLRKIIKVRGNNMTRDFSSVENNITYFATVHEIELTIDAARSDKEPTSSVSFVTKDIYYRNENGRYVDKDGNEILSDVVTELDNPLTYAEYLVNKYTDIALQDGKIEGINDANGESINFATMTKDLIQKYLRDNFFFKTISVKNNLGQIIDKQVPLSIFKISWPSVEEFINEETGITEKTTLFVPTGKYIKKIENKSEKYFNDQFDENSSYSEQPNELYKNKDFLKIKDDPNLYLYYRLLLDMMDNYKNLGDLNSKNNYFRLPQVHAEDSLILSRVLNRSIKKTASDLLKTNLGLTNADDWVRTKNDYTTLPNGEKALRVRPRYFTKLEDPTTISSDLLSSTLLFIESVIYYQNNKDAENKLLTLLYNLGNEVRSLADYQKGKTQRLYFDNLLKTHLYGQLIMYDVDNKASVVRDKVVKASVGITSIYMLANNFGSILTGALDSFIRLLFDTTMVSLNARSLFEALMRGIKEIPQMLANMKNPIPNTLTAALMDRNNLVVDINQSTKSLARNRLVRIASDSLMGMFTFFDYFITSISNNALYYSTRFYKDNGRLGIPDGFYTRRLFIELCEQKGISDLRALSIYSLLRYSLRNAYKFVNGVAVVKDKYKQYVTPEIETRIDTLSNYRAALQNGILASNDQPVSKIRLMGRMILAMRFWGINQYAHLGLLGGNSPSNVHPNLKSSIRSKITQSGATKSERVSKNEKLTRGQYRKAFKHNYATGERDIATYVNIWRALKHWSGLITLMSGAAAGVYSGITFLGDQKGVILGGIAGLITSLSAYIYTIKGFKSAKIAVRDFVATIASLLMLVYMTPNIRIWAENAPTPTDSDSKNSSVYSMFYQAPKTIDDLAKQNTINPFELYNAVESGEVELPDFLKYLNYKWMALQAWVRTTDSKAANTNPLSMIQYVKQMSVGLSAAEEWINIPFLALMDYYGLSGHNPDEKLKGNSSYAGMTRQERAVSKLLRPFLGNIHTSTSRQGLKANINWYFNQSTGVYQLFDVPTGKKEFEAKYKNKGNTQQDYNISNIDVNVDVNDVNVDVNLP